MAADDIFPQSKEGEILAYAQRLRRSALATRTHYPEDYQPDPEWDRLDQFNKDAWVRLARELMTLGGSV